MTVFIFAADSTLTMTFQINEIKSVCEHSHCLILDGIFCFFALMRENICVDGEWKLSEKDFKLAQCT